MPYFLRVEALVFFFSLMFPKVIFAAAIEQIAIPSLDRASILTGEINFPGKSSRIASDSNFPLVVMVPGSGLFNRDVLFGASHSERDFLFKDLANDFLKYGLAVLRYDYRGVSCNLRTMPSCPDCKTPQQIADYYVNTCINNTVRRGVTPENIQDDIFQVYSFATTHGSIDPQRIAVFAHSEGSLHVSKLIESCAINPRAIVFMGMVGESPAGILHWQVVERFLRIFTWGSDQDSITNDEIKSGYAKDTYFSRLGIAQDQLLSPNGKWTKTDFINELEQQYSSMKQEALAAADGSPWPSATRPFSSYKWWKMWFNDDTPSALRLRNYKGRIIAHNGTNDSQTPGKRELALTQPIFESCHTNATLVLHQDLGHGLSKDSPLYGPIEPGAKKRIVADLSTILAL